MRRFALAIAALGAVAVAGCGSSGGSSSSSSRQLVLDGDDNRLRRRLADGSFTQLGKQFEAAHKGDTVKFSFGPSSGLATEITSGAPADVFASAAPANMQQVVSAG